MKNIKNRRSIIIAIGVSLLVIFIGYPSFSRFFSPPPVSQYIIDEQNNIIGTWISEADVKWKLIFTSTGECYNYYDNGLMATYNYSISNSTPQCGEDVLVDESQQTSYLQLTDISTGSNTCYEINGITSALSLMTVGTSNLLVLTRQ